jgi:hypothetical protein
MLSINISYNERKESWMTRRALSRLSCHLVEENETESVLSIWTAES